VYFWRADLLVKDLKEKKVSTKEEFKYALFWVLPYVFYILNISGHFKGTESEIKFWFFLSAACFLIINFFGIYLCYKQNRETDDRDFLKRFICLSCPVTIKMLVYFLALSFLTGLISVLILKILLKPGFDIDENLFNNYLVFGTETILYVFYYSYLLILLSEFKKIKIKKSVKTFKRT
jgi:hypothetical protein